MIKFKALKKLQNFIRPNSFNKFIQETTGYPVINQAHYEKALRHRSQLIKEQTTEKKSNERLEFLGDAVLTSAIADYLFHKFPNAHEGDLTKMKSKIVSRSLLNKIAKKKQLQQWFSHNMNSKEIKNYALGNALEAIIGAVYLDHGFEKAKKSCTHNLLELDYKLNFILSLEENYKGLLLEYAQKNKLTIQFKTSAKANEKGTFDSVIVLNDNLIAQAEGKSKKDAEQNAAKIALSDLNISAPKLGD